MIDVPEPIAHTDLRLPPILRAEHEGPSLGRARWYTTIGPAYLGIFVWAPFFDSLWVGDLTRFPLMGQLTIAIFASLLCFAALYLIPALWGFEAGRPLGLVAASTFGTVGSEWITGVAVGFACIVWYAVAIDYAVDSTLYGLSACGLIAADSLAPWGLGPFIVKSPVYLTTAVFWIYITGTSALWKIPGVVVSLMKVFAPIALVLLTAVALWRVPIHDQQRIVAGLKIMKDAGVTRQWPLHGSAVQLITGFFAMAGLVSVDWGARLERRRDVILGGLTGVLFAASWTAIMSYLAIAAVVAQLEYTVGRTWSSVPQPLSFQWALYDGIGGIEGGTLLVLFGLAALAPACYSAWVYSEKLSTHWPRIGRAIWVWTGGAIALALGATFQASRLEWIFFMMGIVFGPAIGAMAGDWLRQRGGWAGVRPGINRTGVIAWVAGLGIALAVEGYQMRSLEAPPWWYSSTICGFVVSFAYYSLQARLGKEGMAVTIDRP